MGWLFSMGLSGTADHERLASGVDDLDGDRVGAVDLEDPVHLGQQPNDQAAVASGDWQDRSDHLGRAQARTGRRFDQLRNLAVQDLAQFVGTERSPSRP